MIIAHLGIGLLILGITGSSVWQEEQITRMQVNDETTIKNYNIVFKELNTIARKNYLALQGSFWIYNKNKKIIAVLKPENRFYPVTNNSTTEAPSNCYKRFHVPIPRKIFFIFKAQSGDTKRKRC